MDAGAAPVVRGEFLYRDTLLVDVGGEGKRHPRAPESELKALLNGKAPKDQVAHFYEAQLIHYGLQRSKDKNIAKVRLQQALGQGKLKAPPPHITDMEGQMKKDYASAVRKTKAASKSSARKGDDSAATKATKKRKNDEAEDQSSKRTKISMNVGGISINIEQDEKQSSKKKQAASRTSAKDGDSKSTKSGKTVNASPEKPGGNQKAKTTKKSGQDASDTPTRAAAPKATARADTAATSSTPSKSTESRAKAAPKPKAEPKVKAEPKNPNAKTEAKPDVKQEAKVKTEHKVKKEPKPPAPSKVKKEAKIKDEPMDDNQPPQRNVTGVYILSSPQLEEQYPEHADNLRLFLCVDGDVIWGGFQLVIKAGVLRIDGIEADLQMSFGWRARDDYEGLRFGRGCFGEIELFGHEQVTGRIYNMFPEPVYFEGQRRPGPLWCGRSAYSFRQEWDGFVSEAYGR